MQQILAVKSGTWIYGGLMALMVIELGFDDAFQRHAMLIEWPDCLQGLLSDQVLTVTIQATQDGAGRLIDFNV